MYIPGFNPYLEGDFSQLMGIAPSPTFNEVQAPQMDPSMLQFMSLADFTNLIDSERQMGLPELFGSPYGSMYPSFANTAPIEDVQGLAFRDSNRDTLGISNFVRSDPNATFRLVDGAGNVIYEGVGDDALRQAYTQSRDISQTDAGKANWTLLKGGQDGNWTPVASDRPEQSALGVFADIALPTIGSVLLPGLGTFAGAALGAGGGSLVSSALQGRDLGDALLQAGLTGLTAGGLSSLGTAINTPSLSGGESALGGATGGVGGGAGGGATGAMGSIVVPGTSFTPSLISGLSGFTSGLGGNLASQVFQDPGTSPVDTGGQQQYQGQINVTGSTLPTPTGPVAPVPIPPLNIPSIGETVGNPINVTGSNQPAPQQNTAVAPIPPLSSPSVIETVGNDITVKAQQEAARNDAAQKFLEIAGPTALLGGGALAATSGTQTPTDAKKPSTLEQIEKYLGLGGGALAILGDLFGGGGRNNANRTIPGGLFSGQLNPVFSGGLGAPTLAGAAGNFAPRDVDLDWKRYGYGPEQSFFNYAPQARPNTSTAFTGYAEGGEVMGDMPMDSYAVRGPGTGRSDEIPALLSDGEYVIDAETVALLGDGSTEAGAERLDQFRVNLRKHKGQQLAKGGFSPDAKAPEHYLKGGRT
jgi:hypothetical protein